MKKTQTIKLEAPSTDAKLWKEKANAIGLSRQDYLLSLLKTSERRFPPSITSTFTKNSSCSMDR
jgi:hypothetical protein